MGLGTYLRLTLALVLLDAILLGLLYSMQMATGLTPVILGARLLLDITFIGTNLDRIGLKARDGILISWLVMAGLAGGALAFSGARTYSISRVFSDVIPPLLFVLKVSLVVRLLPRHSRLEADIALVVKWLIIGSVLQILIFLTVGRAYGAYAGISVPATLPMADALARHLLPTGGLVLVLVFASGKRAVLISVMAAVGALMLERRRRFLTLVSVVVVAVLMAAILPLFGDTFRKFENTFAATEGLEVIVDRGSGALLDDDVRAGFYLATAGRSEEFYGIVTRMKPVNYIVGLAPGFTYDYAHSSGVVRGYSNSHFSPLSLTYKFGLLFCLVFYWLVFRHTFKLIRSSESFARLVGYSLLMFGIQSMFAFNLFAEPFLPILVGIGAYLCGERYGGAVAASAGAHQAAS